MKIPTPKMFHILAGTMGSSFSLAVYYMDLKRARLFIIIILVITVIASIIIQMITNKIIGYDPYEN